MSRNWREKLDNNPLLSPECMEFPFLNQMYNQECSGVIYFFLLHVQAPFYRSIYAELGLNSKIAFTCHNFEPQGKNSMEALVACGIKFTAPLHKNDFQDDVLPDQINVLKVRSTKAQKLSTLF